MSSEFAAIFDALKTQDFEKVVRALMNAASIVGVYLPKAIRTKKRLSDDADRLKRDLIQAVAGTHP